MSGLESRKLKKNQKFFEMVICVQNFIQIQPEIDQEQ